MKNNLINR